MAIQKEIEQPLDVAVLDLLADMFVTQFLAQFEQRQEVAPVKPLAKRIAFKPSAKVKIRKFAN